MSKTPEAETLKAVTPKKVLSIGGWDPCGAYGVAADIKTFASLGCHGMAALSLATVQNSLGWIGAEFFSATFLAQQLDAILSDYGADALKTGFLGNADLIEVVAQKIKNYNIKNIVIDPVVLNGAGEAMFDPAVKEAYENLLFPLATVITPNLKELNYFLTGRSARWSGSSRAKEQLTAYYQQQFKTDNKPLFCLKGLAHAAPGISFADGWFDGQGYGFFQKDVIATKNLSGSGDTFSAALSAYLAKQLDSKDAIRAASQFSHQAIKASASWRLAHAEGPTANFQ